MGKSTHFIGQPMYNQALKLLDKSKILRISREKGGERYTKRFDGWTHLVVMLYAVIKRFDSLREITTSLLADTNKLAHLVLMVMQKRLTRSWSFSGLASLVGIVLMYYVDFYSLFNNPEKDWENMKILDKNPPPQLTLFV